MSKTYGLRKIRKQIARFIYVKEKKIDIKKKTFCNLECQQKLMACEDTENNNRVYIYKRKEYKYK